MLLSSLLLSSLLLPPEAAPPATAPPAAAPPAAAPPAAAPPAAAPPEAAPPATGLSPWSVGFSAGLGVRDFPKGQVPDTFAPRAELLVLQVRYGLAAPWPAPSRLELQLDWAQRWASESLSTRPRIGSAAYATWLTPLGDGRRVVSAAGVCGEWGHDSFVVDEALTRGPGGAVALGGRVGIERPRRWSNTVFVGWALSGAVGVALGSDPKQPSPMRYTRLGLERSWSWAVAGRQETTP